MVVKIVLFWPQTTSLEVSFLLVLCTHWMHVGQAVLPSYNFPTYRLRLYSLIFFLIEV